MYKRKRSIENPNFPLEDWVIRRKIKMTSIYCHEFCALPQCEAKNKRQDFMFCGRCRIVVYCCKEHQRAHYKYHKLSCKSNEWHIDNFSPSSCPLAMCKCKEWATEEEKSVTKSQPATAATNGSVDKFYPTELGVNEAIENSSVNKQDLKTLNADFKKLFHDSHKNQPESQNQANVVVPVNGMVNGIDKSSRNGSVNINGDTQTVNNAEQESLARSLRKRNRKLKPRIQPLPTKKTVTVNGDCKSTSSKGISNVEEDDLENYAPQCEEIVAVSESQSLTVEEAHLNSSSVNVTVNGGVSNIDSSSPRQDTGSAEESSVSSRTIKQLSNLTITSAAIPFQHRNNLLPLAGHTPQQNRAWMLQVCQQIIEDMDRFGVCVVDNLLGENRGGAVLREVQSMYSSGAFTDGQLVKAQRDAPGASQNIRGDKITWVDGKEPHCRNISILVQLLDNIIMGANSLGNNGKLGNYRIKERSKAMVACYPGSGTQYVKHVDNPNDDGRCVTAIYYLNKDWNTKENGGLLRIFPEGWLHEVADIEPLFDRVIFFWSDRRNPHEVQPAFKTRYAITLWYFDSNAKEQAKLRKEINTSTSVKAAS